jgi:hypothetical protein
MKLFNRNEIKWYDFLPIVSMFTICLGLTFPIPLYNGYKQSLLALMDHALTFLIMVGVFFLFNENIITSVLISWVLFCSLFIILFIIRSIKYYTLRKSFRN